MIYLKLWLPQWQLITKLHAYGTDLSSLKLKIIYQIAGKDQKLILNLPYQRRSYLQYHRVLFWVSLCSISLCMMFLILHEVHFTDYANDKTPLVVRNNITDVISALKEIDEKPLIWFSDNHMKLNTHKFLSWIRKTRTF